MKMNILPNDVLDELFSILKTLSDLELVTLRNEAIRVQDRAILNAIDKELKTRKTRKSDDQT